MSTLIKTTPVATRMSYSVGRGEQGVLSFEPYKSNILPLWRFKTVPIAQKSASDLWEKFLEFEEQDDFVGMDMTRKFIQMGMTRAKRYANHAGGRKYSKETGEELPRSTSHKGQEEKLAASEVFKETLSKCKEREAYQTKKQQFAKEKKAWLKENAAKEELEWGS